jgi:glycosyltransferase involved in cell wall biosynthesis
MAILIEPGDHKAFAGAVAKLSDRGLREKMGQEGFERVKSLFNMKVTARRFLDAISKIC